MPTADHRTHIEQKADGFSPSQDRRVEAKAQPLPVSPSSRPGVFRGGQDLRQDATPTGRLIVFLGVAGGVGTTTLCANVAQALGSRSRTLVLDLAWPLGGLGHLLSVLPQPGVEGLAEGSPAPESLESRLGGGNGGLCFRYLAGYHDLGQALSEPHRSADSLLRTARSLADFVLVDLGSPSGPHAVGVARAADLAVVTLALERTHLAQARALFRWLDELGLHRTQRILVGNRLRPSPLGLREVRRCLGEDIFLTVPNESDRLAGCLNEGRLLISQHPSSAGAIAMAELAAALNREVSAVARTLGENQC